LADPISRINEPELFIGFVAPIGTDLRKSINCFSHYFESQGYKVVPIKVTDVFDRIAPHLHPAEELVPAPEAKRLQTYIKYGNQLREVFEDDALLASLTIARVVQERTRLVSTNGHATAKVAIPEKNVFLLYQFKRREEIDLLRSVYGRAFFQVSVYLHNRTFPIDVGRFTLDIPANVFGVERSDWSLLVEALREPS
jgi:hypothetical protein